MTKGLEKIRTHAEIVHGISQSFALTTKPQELYFASRNAFQILFILNYSLATLLRILRVLAIPMQNPHCAK